MKRKIAAILAADIAGYSRLVAEDEEETLRRLGTYRAVFSDFVARCGGRIFNTAGDATLAEFHSAVDAIRCAVDVQESLRTRNLAYPPNRHMSFRIGITIGDVVERDGDLLGDGVNIASRLESFAPAGGMCISSAVHEAVTKKISLKFDDLGLLQLKNIPDRVHAYAVALDQPTKSRAASLTAWRVLGTVAVLMIAAAGAGVYVFSQSKLPFVSSSPIGTGTETAAVEQGKASVSQPASETTPAPSASAREGEPPPVAADATPAAKSAAAAPKDEAEPAAAPTAVPATTPGADQTLSGAPDKSAQADKAEETCRRFLPSIGKTVEVPCESAREADGVPQSDTAPPPARAEAVLHPFKDMWGSSRAACQRMYGDWESWDRLIIFGSGTLQYIHLGTSQICQSTQIEGRVGTFSLRASCQAVPPFFYHGDITLTSDGQRIIGIGPDRQSLQLSKCD